MLPFAWKVTPLQPRSHLVGITFTVCSYFCVYNGRRWSTGDNNPKGFNECVSQEQLQAVVEDAKKRMNEAIRKAVTNALTELNIGNNMERLDKRISTLTDKVTELELLVAVNNNDVSGSNTDGLLPEDTVHDVTGNMDRAAFR